MDALALAAASDLPALPAPPAWLAAEAWVLRPPPADERAHVMREEAALLLDRLLVRVARGHGAIDVALGDALAALSVGDRTLRLGYSCVGDYACQRLGIAARTAQAMARLARELRSRPLLLDAVRRGEVSARKAQAVLPLAKGEASATRPGSSRLATASSTSSTRSRGTTSSSPATAESARSGAAAF